MNRYAILTAMTEHYALHDIGSVTDRFGLANGVPKGVKPRYNITPTQLAPAIVRSGGVNELQLMRWGLVADDAKDMNSVFRYKTFNTKSEKVFSKQSWDRAVRRKRCIVPANGFYLASVNGGQQYFSAAQRPILGLAGIYSTWEQPGSGPQHVFSILTIAADNDSSLPFTRMPVILHVEDETKWLDESIEDFSTLVSIMRPYEGESIDYHLVSDDILNAKNDSANLIQPVKS